MMIFSVIAFSALIVAILSTLFAIKGKHQIIRIGLKITSIANKTAEAVS